MGKWARVAAAVRRGGAWLQFLVYLCRRADSTYLELVG
jgi:hypothetical protein